ncbi:MAG: M48 family metallopeptidase [Gammaproteobacteria bacterium]|nr:M48 family metallopeptidase [Gammaproteobacteria bacterium]MDH5654139.1 M48 family metallopeptidase [Gammaproteobacteria bacterium]
MQDEKRYSITNKNLQTVAAGYRRKVILLAVLGYAYIFLLLAFIAVLFLLVGKWYYATGTRLLILLEMFFIIVFLIIFSSFWVSIKEPDGRVLRRKAYPALFALLDSYRKDIFAPKIHRVLLSDQFAVNLTQHPRLGIFGWHKNILSIGLPVLQALSPEQFKALVAHEYGHLYGAHGKLDAWACRLEKIWSGMEKKFSTHNYGFLYSMFLGWYVPYLSGHTAKLRRANTFAADAYAASQTDSRITAEALIAFETRRELFAYDLAEEVYAAMNDRPEPGSGMFKQLPGLLNERYHQSAQMRLDMMINYGMMSETDCPSLSERLDALHERPVIPHDRMKSAAEFYLAENYQKLVEEFESAWREAVRDEWREVYEAAVQRRETIRLLRAKAEYGRLTEQEMASLAECVEIEEGIESAISIYRELIDCCPDSVAGLVKVGSYQLEKDDQSGVSHLEKAMKLDDTQTILCCEILHDYFDECDMDDKASEYYNRMCDRIELESQASVERNGIEVLDEYMPHGQTEAWLELLRDQLRKHWQVEDALLVQKKVKLLPHIPALVLAVSRQPGDSELDNNAFMADLIGNLDLQDNVRVFLLTADDNMLRKKLEKVSGCWFYNRQKHHLPGERNNKQAD